MTERPSFAKGQLTGKKESWAGRFSSGKLLKSARHGRSGGGRRRKRKKKKSNRENKKRKKERTIRGGPSVDFSQGMNSSGEWPTLRAAETGRRLGEKGKGELNDGGERGL